MTQDPLVRFLDQRSARYQRRARLRIFGSGELTDAAVSVYQELGGTILRYTATSSLFALAALIFVTEYVLPSLTLTNHPGDVRAQVGEVALTLVIALAVAAPLLTIGVGFSSAFVIGLVADYMNGLIANPFERLKNARKLLPKVALLGVGQTVYAFSGVLLGLGCLMASALVGNASSDDSGVATLVSALAVLGIVCGGIALPIILCRQILILPVTVIEGVGYRAAVRRNRELMKGGKIHVSGYSHSATIFFFCFLLILFIWGGAAAAWSIIGPEQYINDWLKNSVMHDVVLAAVQYLPLFVTVWTVIPVWCVGGTLLYFERRTRLEGYDIEALAQDLGRNAKKNRFDL